MRYLYHQSPSQSRLRRIVVCLPANAGRRPIIAAADFLGAVEWTLRQFAESPRTKRIAVRNYHSYVERHRQRCGSKWPRPDAVAVMGATQCLKRMAQSRGLAGPIIWSYRRQDYAHGHARQAHHHNFQNIRTNIICSQKVRRNYCYFQNSNSVGFFRAQSLTEGNT